MTCIYYILEDQIYNIYNMWYILYKLEDQVCKTFILGDDGNRALYPARTDYFIYFTSLGKLIISSSNETKSCCYSWLGCASLVDSQRWQE